MIEFYTTLSENLWLYVLTLTSTIGLLYLIFRKKLFSVFDPILYYLVITESFCIADVFLMAKSDLIPLKYTIQYFSSEAALFIGFLLFKVRIPSNPVRPQSKNSTNFELNFLFVISSLLFIGLNIFVYATRGIPLLVENRLEIFQLGGGFGFITRAFDVLLVIIIYYLFEVHRRRKWNWKEQIILFMVIFMQVLSGAKSAVLTLVFIISIYVFLSGKWSKFNEHTISFLKKVLAAAILGFLIISQIQASDINIGGQNLSVLEQMALRMVNNGDAFVYAYSDNLIDKIDNSSPLSSLFREYIAFFRLATPEQLPMHIGLEMSKYFNGLDATTQTNAKHNIFGYVNFGQIGGVIFSFLLGTLIGTFRYKTLAWFSSSWKFGIPYIIINLGIITSISDFDNFSRSVINILFIFYPLSMISLLYQRAIFRQ